MKLQETLILSLVAPLMILLSIFGLISRNDKKKIFYFPMGLMGISIILEKEVSRKLKRQKIYKKIKQYQKK